MITEEMKTQLKREIPELLRQDEQFRAWLEELIRQTAVSREHFDACFEKLLRELAEERAERRRETDEQNRKWDEQNRKWEEQNRKWDEQNRKWEEQNREQNRKWDEQNRKWEEQNREQNCKWDEQNRKWEEQNREQNRKWDEQNRRWEEQRRQWGEQNRKWEEQNRRLDEQNRRWEEQNLTNQKLLEEIALSRSRYEQGIGALGARWGVASEQSFREALKGILENSFNVKILHINEFDDEGLVFGRPDQVEIDLIIKNGLLILCELKSSMSKSDMYTFQRKVEYYEKRHQRTVQRKLVISPMVHPSARQIAEHFGIEVFSYVEDATDLTD